MLDGLARGFSAAVSWEHLLVILLATIAGLLVGIIPGLGPITAMALLIPFTFSMDPLSALLALASISIAANCSGSFTSILFECTGGDEFRSDLLRRLSYGETGARDGRYRAFNR